MAKRYEDSKYAKCDHIIGHDKHNKIVKVSGYDIAFDKRKEIYNMCPLCGLKLFIRLKDG